MNEYARGFTRAVYFKFPRQYQLPTRTASPLVGNFWTYSRQVRLRSVFRPLYKITKRQYHDKNNKKKGFGSALMPGVPIPLVGVGAERTETTSQTLTLHPRVP